MASVQSLGLHQPSALPYLIAESLLPADPSPDQYVWQTFSGDESIGGKVAEEEVLYTKDCVVWSQGGIVKRVYRLGIEKEPILQAFTTCFKSGAKPKVGQDGLSRNTSENVKKLAPGALPATKHRKSANIHARFADEPSTSHNADGGRSFSFERALVIVLKTQAHIYMLSGDIYTIPIPFEVSRAFPASQGFALQRKHSAKNAGSFQLQVPQNSLISSQLSGGLQTSQIHHLTSNHPSRPSLIVSPARDTKWNPSAKDEAVLPRLFSLTSPQSQLGLVVTSLADRDHDEDGFGPLDVEEELQYLSQANELSPSTSDDLLLAVTSNSRTHTFTVWKVKYRENVDRFTGSLADKSTHSNHLSRRRSSNVFGMGTGANTPGGNANGILRESFGGAAESSSQLRTSVHPKQTVDDEDSLAIQLEQEFGDRGVQTKAGRRVSSLLARTDLAASHDRSTFPEMNATAANKSMNKPSRRGESFGSFADRASLGRRRSSFQGETSMLSVGSSYLDAPVDHLLEELNNSGTFHGFDQMELQDNMFDLQKEILFSKIETFPQSTGGRQNKSVSPRPPKIFILPWPVNVTALSKGALRRLSLCIHDASCNELTVLDLKVHKHLTSADVSSKSRSKALHPKRSESTLVVQASDFRRGSDIADAEKVMHDNVCRILTLTNSNENQSVLHLEAPWSPSFKLDISGKLRVHDPFALPLSNSSGRWQEGSWRRIIGQLPSQLSALHGSSGEGRFDLVDQHNRRHRLRLQLQPRDSQVRGILSAMALVLCDRSGENLFVAWWEILQWLHECPSTFDKEWEAMVITIFCMAVPYLPERKGQKTRSKTIQPESLLGPQGDVSNNVVAWADKLGYGSSYGGYHPRFLEEPAWNWIQTEYSGFAQNAPAPPLPPQPGLPFSTSSEGSIQLRPPLLFADLARAFLQTEAGKQAIGAEGYLPTAISKPREARQTALAKVVIALHLLREEHKLDTRSNGKFSGYRDLGPIIAQIGGWLGWHGWDWKDGTYFGAEMQELSSFQYDESRITSIETPDQPFDPPSIFNFAEQCLHSSGASNFFNLVDIVQRSTGNISKQSLTLLHKQADILTPITFIVTNIFGRILKGSSKAQLLETIFQSQLSAENSDMLPFGISTPLLDILVAFESDAPSSWLGRLMEFLGREGSLLGEPTDTSHTLTAKSHSQVPHDAVRDLHGTVNSATDTESFHSFDATAEADRVTLTRLLFREDRRFHDATKLVNQLKAPVAECNPEPDWSEADLLEAQKELVQLVTMRTLAVSSGRGMIQYNARVPLLTERVHIPAFTMQCFMRPMNITLNAERSSITEDKVSWAFFHNGASTGLTITKNAKGIDTSWILYNKPSELTNRHAGFLLALGLNGHLKNLAKWVAFKYLTPKHTMTSIGLLLGLSASYIGTMDTLITRLLSVHVTRMLPPGAAELNLSPLTQTTGLMGIGLLYCSSQHRRMSEVMISEIENTSVEEPPLEVLRDEGYRLAAGFALGLINLGKGSNLQGLHDMNITERLLNLAIGARDVHIVHVLDRATVGATVALALIFMKTNDRTIARKIDIPDTTLQFGYVRPDMFLLRTLAKHLILWSDIRPTFAFVRAGLPKIYRHRSTLKSIRNLVSNDLPLYNTIAGLLMSIGFRYAGSGSHHVRDLLLSYLDQFMRLARSLAPDYDARLTRNSLRNCQDAIALALSTVMAGTGDLLVLRRLRSLHGRLDTDTTYGSHLAAHMALGALFLGGGTHTFGTGNVAIASLLCAFWPVFPTTVLDNKSHLQAFRHLWVLAAEARCLVTRDVESKRPISVRVELTMKDKTVRHVTSPCLLPELADIKSLKTASPDHWDVTLNFDDHEPSTNNNDEQSSAAMYSRISALYLSRRAAYDAPQSSVFVSALQALDDADPAPGISSATASSTTQPVSLVKNSNANPFDWLWSLSSFKDLDVAEKALVLPPHGQASSSASGLRGTVVDTRLSLEKGILPPEPPGEGEKRKMPVGPLSRDKLWQVRLLVAWVEWKERMERREEEESKKGEGEKMADDEGRKGGGGVWLRKEVVEGLKWRVWKMGAGADEVDE
ncbi:MAG: hypothetical protein Q9227_008888 [Pyrenula ochraceoflavens]